MSVAGGVRVEETSPDRVTVSRLAVRADRTGEGIRIGLLEHVERIARGRGYAAVWRTTPGEHPTLPAFYRDRGYEVTGPYPLAHRTYDEVVVAKRLP